MIEIRESMMASKSEYVSKATHIEKADPHYITLALNCLFAIVKEEIKIRWLNIFWDF